MVLSKKNRSLSPHLTIYKPQLTSIASILHRLSGFLLSLVSIFLIFLLLLDIICSEFYFAYLLHYYSNVYFYALVSCTFLLFFLSACFHFINGVRHLSWDFGLGLRLTNTYTTSLAIFIITLVALLVLILF